MAAVRSDHPAVAWSAGFREDGVAIGRPFHPAVACCRVVAVAGALLMHVFQEVGVFRL
jgi:hypothetical protein